MGLINICLFVDHVCNCRVSLFFVAVYRDRSAIANKHKLAVKSRLRCHECGDIDIYVVELNKNIKAAVKASDGLILYFTLCGSCTKRFT